VRQYYLVPLLREQLSCGDVQSTSTAITTPAQPDRIPNAHKLRALTRHHHHHHAEEAGGGASDVTSETITVISSNLPPSNAKPALRALVVKGLRLVSDAAASPASSANVSEADLAHSCASNPVPFASFPLSAGAAATSAAGGELTAVWLALVCDCD
jgi:hypothetical protein